MTATATRRETARETTEPVQTEPYTTYTKAPLPLTKREEMLLVLVRETYTQNPEASTVNLSTESLRVLLGQIDRLEAERDREGDHALQWRTRAQRIEKQFDDMLVRYGKLVTWASKQLRCSANLSVILKKIGGK